MDSSKVFDVIKFAYDEYTVEESKEIVSAKCRRCTAIIREKLGMTSAFVRHISSNSSLPGKWVSIIISVS